MSVSEPADSGGGIAALSQDLQGFEDMNTVGAWAKMMEEDVSCSQVNSTIDEEEEPERNERIIHNGKKLPDGPPYSIQVTNVAYTCDPMDLYYYFGGDKEISNIECNESGGKADIVFHTREGLISAIEKNGVEFCNKKLKVYVIDPSRERRSAQIDRADRISSARDSRDSHGGRSSRDQRDYRDQYNRGSHYSSQNSVYSNDARGYEHRDHRDHRNNYNTLPRNSNGRGGGRYDDRYGGHRGSNYNQRGNSGYQGGRGGYRNSLDRSRQGDMQDYKRSDSYTYENDRPAPINRSRTESTTSEQADRRRMEMNSRTSSRVSLNHVDDDRPAPVRKPTSRDIFGDAKPVDTADRIREIEEKQEREKKMAAERERMAREKEKEREHAHVPSTSQNQQYHHPQHSTHPPHASHPPHGVHHPHHAQGNSNFDPSRPPPPRAEYSNYHQGYGRPPKFQQPTYQTPLVNQPSARFDGGVGSVSIMKREDKEKGREHDMKESSEHHNASLSQADSSEDIHKKDDKGQSFSSTDPQPSKRSHNVRTFTSTRLQKSATSDQINDNSRGYRGRGGGRGGRGQQGGRGSLTSDRRSSYSSQQDVSRDKNEGPDGSRSHQHGKGEKKDHHGSQASLRSVRGSNNFKKPSDRGGARGGYYNANKNYKDQRGHHKEDRPPREDKHSRDEGKPQKEHQKPPRVDQPPKESSKPEEVKKSPPQQEQQQQQPQQQSQQAPPVQQPEHRDLSPKDAVPKASVDNSVTNEDGNSKKKDKKKVKKESTKIGKSLKGNKYAALANVDD